tara:strand:- start:3943 stop:4551 length:609 start_codon:yes stop_codon:yes gene_type:complete
MIGRLKGIIIAKQAPQLLLDVNGVGYEIDATMGTFYNLANVGEEAVIYTHFVVREDAQQLYGFRDASERQLFRTLIKVNGVGPKLALTILSSIEPNDFVKCVMDNNTQALVRLPGVGKKTAERLIIEMRDRLADWQGSEGTTTSSAVVSSVIEPIQSIMQEAISALVSLGYKPQDASKAISRVNEEGKSSEELIRLALQGMS